MDKLITILYANRNRDLIRIKSSFDSLQNQSNSNFNVVFVDYGSEEFLVNDLEQLCNNYEFVTPYFLAVSQLLWNKSKALNYGFLQSQSPYIFIADVDLIFHPNAIQLLLNLSQEGAFYLFKLGYLDKAESQKLTQSYRFEELKPTRVGEVNGMILAPRKAFIEVNGLDEFFHFYGSEDEDLFARMENAGYKRYFNGEPYFYHNWHQSFAGSEDKLITGNPRIKNIMRINQRHFLHNREKRIIKPNRQVKMGKVIGEENDLLKMPTKNAKIYNIKAHVEHFLGEDLPSFRGEIIKAEFLVDPYYLTLKYKVKKFLGKQTQPYCSLKEVNDMLLKEILFRYRDANYSFKISKDLQVITFVLDLKNKNTHNELDVPST